MIVATDNLSKEYDGVYRVQELDIRIKEGDIYGFLGPNGAGKSTTMKMLLGLVKPTSGTIEIMGKPFNEKNLRDILASVGSLIESPSYYGHLTGRENMEIIRRLLDLPKKNIEEAVHIVRMENQMEKKVKNYSLGMKQRLGIAMALARFPKLLILDEPTASLNEEDSKALLDLMLAFKKQGMTMIIITHKLNEVSYVADKITIIRDGSTIETLDKKTDNITEERIIKGMVGRELTSRFPKREPHIGDVELEVKDWTVYHNVYAERKVVDNVSIHVCKGEVVGISGLMGAGRTELAMSIFGKSYGKNISGKLFIEGKEVKNDSVQEAIEHKIAYVTEDRKGNGLILSNPIRVNTTLANLQGVSRHGVIDKDKEIAVSEEYRKKLKTKCPSVEQNVGNLSGGNQQKVLLAKWMYAGPDVLILDEPTRGIDVGAKAEIYKLILELAKQGKTILINTLEIPEIQKVADYCAVFYNGEIIKVLEHQEIDEMTVMMYSTNAAQAEEGK